MAPGPDSSLRMFAPTPQSLLRDALALSLILSHASANASGPFDGTWYLDAQRSSFPDVLQLQKRSDGTWTYFDGSIVLTLKTDGEVHRTGSSAFEDRALQPDPQTLLIASGIHGREFSETTLSLSADRKTLVRTSKRWGWDGKEKSSATTFARTTPGNTLQGTWKGVPDQKSPTTADARPTDAKPGRKLAWVIWTGADGTMTWFIPNTGETLRGKADSKPRRIQGPYHDGETFTWHQTSPNVLQFTVYIDRKPVEYAEETISPDGQTYTDSLWAPGHEDTKLVSVFTRQP